MSASRRIPSSHVEALLRMENNVILIGFMGAGKTTVGEELAARLGRPFVDLDAVVEEQAGATIPDIFAREGELGFRRREAAAVHTVCREPGQVIATGGGTVMNRDSLARLRAAGTLVWLRAGIDELLARAKAESGKERPLLQSSTAKLNDLYARRESVYALADHVIDTNGKQPEKVAEEIERMLHGDGGPPPTTVAVGLGERAYNVHVGAGVLTRTGELCAGAGLGQRGLLVTNETVGGLYGVSLQRSMSLAHFRVPLLHIPEGEDHKTLATVERVFRAAVAHKLDRQSFIIALGGGVVGDVAGFAAAAYLRGIGFVQVPTTLLAQVDAAVGGKTGVNLDEGKNLVGAFHQPRVVIADVDTLASLPRRELAAGLAEVIKYGVIADPDLYHFLEDRMDQLLAGDRAALMRIVARSCEIKARIVAADERETKGVRDFLNFGHTIGHALEAIGQYTALLHGEAVSIGMVAAATLSARLCGFPEAEVERLVSLLSRVNLPVTPPSVDERQLVTVVRRDKKVRADQLRFVLLERVGEPVVVDGVPEEFVLEVMREQRMIQERRY